MSTINDMLENHGRVISYLRAADGALTDFADSATPPSELPDHMVAEVRARAREYAEVISVASGLMAESPVVLTVMVAAMRQADESAEEPEIQLTTRKVAQA